MLSSLLQQDIQWVKQIIDGRLKEINAYYQPVSPHISVKTVSFQWLSAPDLSTNNAREDVYLTYCIEHNLKEAERFLLTLALLPHIEPFYLTRTLTHGKQVTDTRRVQTQYVRYDTPKFLEFGLMRDRQLGYYLPTGITFLYLWAGEDEQRRFEVLSLLNQQHPFFAKEVLQMPASQPYQIWGSQPLLLNEQYLQQFAIATF